MIEVYQTSVGWQFRMKVHGTVLMESLYYYETKLKATRAVAGRTVRIPIMFQIVTTGD